MFNRLSLVLASLITAVAACGSPQPGPPPTTPANTEAPAPAPDDRAAPDPDDRATPTPALADPAIGDDWVDVRACDGKARGDQCDLCEPGGGRACAAVETRCSAAGHCVADKGLW